MTDQPAVPHPSGLPALRVVVSSRNRSRGFLAVVLAVLVDWLLFRPADPGAWADVIRSTALALAFMAAVPAGYVAYRRQQTAEAEHQPPARRSTSLISVRKSAGSPSLMMRTSGRRRKTSEIGTPPPPPRSVPISPGLVRLYIGYMFDEYGQCDSDYVFVSLFAEPWAAVALPVTLR